MYFSTEQRAAFRRIPYSKSIDISVVKETNLLFNALSISARPDQESIQVFDAESVKSCIKTSEQNRICFVPNDLRVKYHSYSNNRKIVSEIIAYAGEFGYVVEDAIVFDQGISAAIIFVKSSALTGPSYSNFLPDYGFRDKLFNLKFRSPGDSIRVKSVVSGDFYEPILLRHVLDNYQGGAIIDIGANIGNHSVFFAHYLQDKQDFHLDAFEPEDSAYSFLKENMLNNVSSPNVELHNVAVGSVNGSVELNNGSPNNLGAARVTRSSSTESLEIPMKKLDDIIHKSKRVSIIKMDIEGFEPDALYGGYRVLSENSPILYIEAENEDRKKKIDSIVEPLGYSSRGFVNDTPTYIYKK